MTAEAVRPLVSVVIPTYNRAAKLRRSLESVVAQELNEPYEVVVADDGSTDATAEVAAEVAARHVNVRYVPLPHGGLNSARNGGIEAAAGDLICLIDDDVLAPQGWLAAMVGGWRQHPEAACFGGPIRLVTTGPPPRGCGREQLGETVQDLGPDVTVAQTLYGSNLALTRAAYEQAGRFDTNLPSSGDEEEWLRRVQAGGGTLLYLPDAGLDHERNAGDLRLAALLRKRYVRGRDQVVYLRMTGAPVSARDELRQVVRSTGHSVLRRCPVGLLPAAASLGRLVAIARGGRSSSSSSG